MTPLTFTPAIGQVGGQQRAHPCDRPDDASEVHELAASGCRALPARVGRDVLFRHLRLLQGWKRRSGLMEEATACDAALSTSRARLRRVVSRRAGKGLEGYTGQSVPKSVVIEEEVEVETLLSKCAMNLPVRTWSRVPQNLIEGLLGCHQTTL
eukprot:754154-Hanusia_phi.AAC.2